MQIRPEEKYPHNISRGSRLSRKSAAEYLGITGGTLAQWASIGHPYIPYHKIGKKVVYMQADLDEFLATHRVEKGEQ